MGQVTELKKRIDEQCAALGKDASYSSKSTIDQLTEMVAELDEELEALEESQSDDATGSEDAEIGTTEKTGEGKTDATLDTESSGDEEPESEEDEPETETLTDTLKRVKAVKTFTYRQNGKRVKVEAGKIRAIATSQLEGKKGPIAKGVAVYVD